MHFFPAGNIKKVHLFSVILIPVIKTRDKLHKLNRKEYKSHFALRQVSSDF